MRVGFTSNGEKHDEAGNEQQDEYDDQGMRGLLSELGYTSPTPLPFRTCVVLFEEAMEQRRGEAGTHCPTSP